MKKFRKIITEDLGKKKLCKIRSPQAVHTRLDLCAIRTQYDFCNLYDVCDTCDISYVHGGCSALTPNINHKSNLVFPASNEKFYIKFAQFYTYPIYPRFFLNIENFLKNDLNFFRNFSRYLKLINFFKHFLNIFYIVFQTFPLISKISLFFIFSRLQQNSKLYLKSAHNYKNFLKIFSTVLKVSLKFFSKFP